MSEIEDKFVPSEVFRSQLGGVQEFSEPWDLQAAAEVLNGKLLVKRTKEGEVLTVRLRLNSAPAKRLNDKYLFAHIDFDPEGGTIWYNNPNLAMEFTIEDVLGVHVSTLDEERMITFCGRDSGWPVSVVLYPTGGCDLTYSHIPRVENGEAGDVIDLGNYKRSIELFEQEF